MIQICEESLSKIAKDENVSIKYLEKAVQSGLVVILKNSKRKLKKPCGIGKALRTKINANIGLSSGYSSIRRELEKMEAAIKMGADTIMDLSTGPSIEKVRKEILSSCPVPLGTVPIYELASSNKKRFTSRGEKDFIEAIERQAEEGVDFFTVHSGFTEEALSFMTKKSKRIMNVVSRGGALLASWMIANRRENPFFSHFDEILDIAKKYNITLSLGDSLRPGAVSDATDYLQIQELLILGQLQKKALSKGVQVMIEGPGHMPLNQIEANVKLEKSVCGGAPFYVLGPLVTDAAPGYDHITGAIGGAIAAWHGADFLCYVTPAEHVHLPTVEDVRQGVIASKIAAHAADIVKGIPSAIERDKELSKARARRDWKKQFKLSLDPEKPMKMRKAFMPKEKDICTMCAEYCSIKTIEESIG